MKATDTQATILEPHMVNKQARRKLPASWKSAAGMLRHHKKGLDRYIARVRNEWK